MVRKLGEWPDVGELVVARVTSIKSDAAFVELLEYRAKEGMVHVSEISSRWVRNIRNFVKEGEIVVLRVVKVVPKMSRIDLSLKRVSKGEKREKLEEFKLEKRAERLLELVGKKFKKDLDAAYAEAGNMILKKFGLLYDGFEQAATGPEPLIKAGLSRRWASEIAKIAKREIKFPEKEVSRIIEIKSFEPDGIEIIKKALDVGDVSIHYLGAPRYMIKVRDRVYKEAEKKLAAVIEEIKSKIGNKGEVEQKL